MKERDIPGGMTESLGAFPADSAAPGHDNLYDEDVMVEVATEISDLAFSNNVPRRVIRARGAEHGEDGGQTNLAQDGGEREAGSGGNPGHSAAPAGGGGLAKTLLARITRRMEP